MVFPRDCEKLTNFKKFLKNETRNERKVYELNQLCLDTQIVSECELKKRSESVIKLSLTKANHSGTDFAA